MSLTSRQLLAVLIFIALASFSMLLFITPDNKTVKPQDKMSNIVLPDALMKNFHFEPSAILWVEEFDAYLVVSDDTGRGNVKNIPYLFLMDINGKIHSDMVKLNGIRQIEDLESVCRDDDGFIYLLGSQSTTLKGKRTAARELFLKTEISGKNLEVISYVHLSTMLGNISRTHENFLEKLGITDLLKLDIEGMAYYDQKLYLGLNAPLKKDKYALIWCVDGFSRIFDTPDNLDALAGSFSLWGKTALGSYNQKGLFDGISDMIFTTAGDLILLSGRKKGGFLWHVKSPESGLLKPEILQGLKRYNPEGVCLSPGQEDMVTVVFDQGKDIPAWMTYKIP